MPQEAAEEEPAGQRVPLTPGPWWGSHWCPDWMQGVLGLSSFSQLKLIPFQQSCAFFLWSLFLKFCAVESILDSTWNYFFGLFLHFKCRFLHVKCNSQVRPCI